MDINNKKKDNEMIAFNYNKKYNVQQKLKIKEVEKKRK